VGRLPCAKPKLYEVWQNPLLLSKVFVYGILGLEKVLFFSVLSLLPQRWFLEVCQTAIFLGWQQQRNGHTISSLAKHLTPTHPPNTQDTQPEP